MTHSPHDAHPRAGRVRGSVVKGVSRALAGGARLRPARHVAGADLAAADSLDDAMTRRCITLADHAATTSGAGGVAASIHFTCSAFGPAIEAVQERLAIPVLRPNEAAFPCRATAPLRCRCARPALPRTVSSGRRPGCRWSRGGHNTRRRRRRAAQTRGHPSASAFRSPALILGFGPVTTEVIGQQLQHLIADGVARATHPGRGQRQDVQLFRPGE